MPRFRACLAATVVVLACAGCLPPRDHATLPEVSEGMVTWSTTQWQDANAAQLSHGRETMIASCTECHSMPSPDHESAAEWPSVVKSMGKKAKLADADQTAVLRFILAARASVAK